MDYAQQQRNPARHLTGLTVVVVLHLLLAWALVVGLGRTIVDVMRAPIETKIIEEIKPPPPPPPTNLPPPPRTAPPPPAFVPPPEVQVTPPPTPAPTITTTPIAPPPAPMRIEPAAPVVVAPPAPAPAAPPAPPAAPVRTAPKLDFNACTKPDYNAATRRADAQGTVVVAYTMDTNGTIAEARVEKSSGSTREHKMLDRMTLEAVQACKGTPGTLDGKPEKLAGRIEYVWRLTE